MSLGELGRPALKFQVVQTDVKGRARRGQLSTARGDIETPAFMPVGSIVSVKGVERRDLVFLG